MKMLGIEKRRIDNQVKTWVCTIEGLSNTQQRWRREGR